MKLTEAKILVFDTETTGVDTATDRIVELGAVLIEGGRIGKTMLTKLNPGVSLLDWLTDRPVYIDDVGAFPMNAPYGGRMNLAQKFIMTALDRAQDGASIWALLRVNWVLDGEATCQRQTWMREGPGAPDVFGLNKRPSFTGDGKADATTYAWCRWVKGAPRTVGAFHILDCQTARPDAE